MHAAMAVTSPSTPYAYTTRLHQTLEPSCSPSSSASAPALSRRPLSPKVQSFFRLCSILIDYIFLSRCVCLKAAIVILLLAILILPWLFCRSRASSALGFRFPVDSIRRCRPHRISCGVVRAQLLGQVSLGFVFVIWFVWEPCLGMMGIWWIWTKLAAEDEIGWAISSSHVIYERNRILNCYLCTFRDDKTLMASFWVQTIKAFLAFNL